MNRLFFVFLTLGFFSLYSQEEAPAPSKLPELIKNYDASTSNQTITNTTKIQEEIWRLVKAKQPDDIEKLIKHKDFWKTAIWALSEIGDADSVDVILQAADTKNDDWIDTLLNHSPFFGKNPKLLQFWASYAQENNNQLQNRFAQRFHGCLLAAGHPNLEANIKNVLEGTNDPQKLQAIMWVGCSRDTELCASLLSDVLKNDNKLPQNFMSTFMEYDVIEAPEFKGGKSYRAKKPFLMTTWRDLAVEAFNLSKARPHDGGKVVDYERGPANLAYFGQGKEAVKKIKAEIKKMSAAEEPAE